MTRGKTGSVLNVGRKRRTISPVLRRELEERDRGCRFPGCGLRFTDAHHLEHWADGGETSLENCALLCDYHDMLVHEGGWRVEGWGVGRAVFVDPRGGIHFDGGLRRTGVWASTGMRGRPAHAGSAKQTFRIACASGRSRRFARIRCDACAAERLVAFSFKGRGVCPSCNARRMVEVAAHHPPVPTPSPGSLTPPAPPRAPPGRPPEMAFEIPIPHKRALRSPFRGVRTMSPTEIVNRYTQAFDAGDMATVQSLLAEDFRFEGPLMKASNRREFFEQLAQFEMQARTVVRGQIANGTKVARTFDFELTAPAQVTIPMAEWLEVEGGRIVSSRLFYDPALFPKP